MSKTLQFNDLKDITNKRILEGELQKYMQIKDFRDFDTLKKIAIIVNSDQLNNHYDNTQIDTIVNTILKNQIPTYISPKGAIIPYELADHIKAQENFISDLHYIYNYNTMYYEKIDSIYNYINPLITDKSKFTSNCIKETTTHLMELTKVEAVQQQRGYINFKNGLYDIEKRMLIPHTPDIVTLGTINANYIKGSNIDNTEFKKFVCNSLNIEYMQVILELIGVSLHAMTDKRAYFYILLGEGRNGKGILLKILEHLVPSSLLSKLSIEQFAEKFTNSSLKNSMLNIASDDGTVRTGSLGTLKTITSAESITVEEKNKPAMRINPILTHISAFNTFPSMQEKDNAFWDRAIIIPFNTTFGTIEEKEAGLKDKIGDPNLFEKLKNETDIIASVAVDALINFIDNGYKFYKTKEMETTANRIRLEKDTVRQWIYTRVERVFPIEGGNPNKDYISNTQLYKKYLSFCSDEELRPVEKQTFNKIINDALRRFGYKEIRRAPSYLCYALDYNKGDNVF